MGDLGDMSRMPTMYAGYDPSQALLFNSFAPGFYGETYITPRMGMPTIKNAMVQGRVRTLGPNFEAMGPPVPTGRPMEHIRTLGPNFEAMGPPIPTGRMGMDIMPPMGPPMGMGPAM